MMTPTDRIASNRSVINVYRTSGSEPIIQPAPLVHSCRNCAGHLLLGQPCGAYCKKCALTLADEDTEELTTGGAVTVALLGVLMLAFGLLIGRCL